MFMFRKNQVVYRKIKDYLQVVSDTNRLFGVSMDYYLEQGIDDHFNALAQKTYKRESDADDLRREIEAELYEKSLLPESREDILQIIDKVDWVANKCESILRRLYTQNIRLPRGLNGKVKELIDLSIETTDLMLKAVDDVLTQARQIKILVRKIDSNESIGDQMEMDMVYEIFHGDYDPVDRLMFRDIINLIGDLLDLAETISDNLTIFAIKRQV